MTKVYRGREVDGKRCKEVKKNLWVFAEQLKKKKGKNREAHKCRTERKKVPRGRKIVVLWGSAK